MKGKRVNHPLSARIKKIMQADEDVGKIAQATPVILGRAVELFVKQLCDGAVGIASAKDARTLSAAHMKAFVMSHPTMDFLKQTVAGAPDLAAEDDEAAPKPKRRRKTAEEGPGSPKAGRGRGRKAALKVEEADEDPAELQKAAAVSADDETAGVKPEEMPSPVSEARASEAEPAVAGTAKQDDAGSERDPGAGTEIAQAAQPALAALPLLPIGIPAAAGAAITEEDDYDDFD